MDRETKLPLECLIVGGGPAGLLAAVYLGRYRRRVMVVDGNESRAATIPESHNYPGFAGLGGQEMLRRLTTQARQYGAEVIGGHVRSLRKLRGAGFVATHADGCVRAEYVLLATGIVDRCPPIEGHPPGSVCDPVRFCPICDGYELIDRRVAVVGDIAKGGKEALFLRSYTRNVALFLTGGGSSDAHWREKLRNAGVRIAGKLGAMNRGKGKTVTISTESGESQEVDAVYPALGCDVRSELGTVLGASTSLEGSLRVDDHQQSTVDGLYAAGDVVTDLHQLSVAFGHAAIAATAIHNRLPSNPR